MRQRRRKQKLMEDETEGLPERINVMKLVTYDVESVRQQIVGDDENVTLDEIIERIHLYAKDDFSCGYGHEVNLRDLIFTDENGEEY